MDINSRINWSSGMELTTETFAGMDRHIDFQQRVAIQAALGSQRVGILPEVPFDNSGVFVKNCFEMEHFRCMALLASGRIVDVDEPVVVTIPRLFGDCYYLTVGFGEGQAEYEQEGVPYKRPNYRFALNTMEEIESNDLLPVVRFKANEGVFSLDSDFIPPTLQLVCDPRFKPYIDRYAKQMNSIASHEHLTDEFGKRAMLHYLFILKSYSMRMATTNFILFTQELAQAINYYIHSLNPQSGLSAEIPEPNQYDIEKWLKWLEEYLNGAVSVLDNAEPKDNTIDYELLKAQIKAELYETITPELHDRMLPEIKEQLSQELEQKLAETLKDKLEYTLKPQLYSQLRQELSDDLFQQLFDTLYEALYKALFVPVEKEEEKEFIPMI